MNIKIHILNTLKKLSNSTLEYKFPSFFAFLFSIVSTIFIALGNYKDDYIQILLSNIMYTSSLGFLLTLVAYFSKSKKTLLTIALVLLSLYFYALTSFGDNYSQSILVNKYFSLIIIAIIILLYIPFGNQERQNQKYLYWAINIAQSFCFSLIFGSFLFLALVIAIFSIDTLFNISFMGLPYLAIIIFGIFTPHYFLLSLNKKPNDVETNLVVYNKIGNFFSKYILTTIVVIYSLILLGYIIKILLLQEWPNGIVVWLCLTFAIFSLITYISWTPYNNKYKKLLIFVALIQLSLLFTAIFMRIEQYGWTTNRYMIVMVGLWLAGSFVYILFYKKYRYDYIFLALAILLFISQYGYKINSYYINDVIQFDKLNKLLSENNKFSDKIPKTIRCDISSSIHSLVSHENKYFLSKAMPEIYDKYIKKYKREYLTYNFTEFATKELGFNYLDSWMCKKDKEGNYDEDKYKEDKYIPPEYTFILTIEHTQYGYKNINISGYDIMYKNIEIKNYDEVEEKPFKIRYKNDKYLIFIPTKNKDIVNEFDITELISKFDITDSYNIGNIKDEETTYIAQNKNMKLKIIFYNIKIDKKSKNIVHIKADILIKYL